MGATLKLPCGQCVGCRIDSSRQWALRIMHESQMHEQCSFITLTYDDEHLPENGSLVLEDWQKFAKRLRKNLGPFRFFHCGEYGDRKGRPHYHACIMGQDFWDDRDQVDEVRGHRYYKSKTLTELWRKGEECIIGELTFDSAAYVARYCLKKMNGKAKTKINPKTGLSHYERLNKQTGEVVTLKPEYTTMSRGGRGGQGGIGASWIKKWMTDVYKRDFVIANSHKSTVPKYYDGLYEIDHPKELAALKETRIEKTKRFEKDNTPERLAARAKVAQGQIDLYKRNHSND